MRFSRQHYSRAISLTKPHQRCYSAPTDGAIPPSKQKYIPTSGTYPKGFVAGSAHAGVKPSNTKFDDLALIASTVPGSAAGVFTTNAFKAAPVQVSSKILQSRKGDGIRGVVINSGCANAVTGSGGVSDAVTMAKMADEHFLAEGSAATSEGTAAAEGDTQGTGASDSDGSGTALDVTAIEQTRTLVMSTGVIGQRLPMDRITSKIPDLYASLGDSHNHWLGAAKAICTTDTFPKLISRTFTLPSHPETQYSIAGMTKGAGMIHPNMATLLSVICTDAKIHRSALLALLRTATTRSFNSISIDGDTSTNDTVNIFANGVAAPENQPPVYVNLMPSKKGPTLNQHMDYTALQSVLNDFMVDLAKLVVRDGEGATKFVTIKVTGAKDDESAKNVANSIAKSPLVKTALYGKDANWGRILCAVGYSDAKHTVNPRYTSVSFVPTDGSEELKLLVRGEPETVDEARAKQILEMEDLEILVRLNDRAAETEKSSTSELGLDSAESSDKPQTRNGKATMWTCDFSHEYVTINGDYRT